MARDRTDVRPRKPAGRRKPHAGEEWVTTRAGSPEWHYDFSIDGCRLRGSCGTADLAAASAYAARRHAEEFDRIRLGKVAAPRLTLNEAAVRWWDDRGKGTTYGERGQRHQIARMIRILGGETPLEALDDGTVARLIRGLRDGEGVNEGHETRGQATPATCNRYLATLSVVCTYAREVLGAEVGGWRKKLHLQREPEGRERFLTHDQARVLVSEIVAHSRPLVMFDLLTGMRRGNVSALRWEDVSLQMRRAVFIQKGNRRHAVDLAADAVRLLEWLQPDAEKRTGLIFTYGLESVGCRCPHCSSALFRGRPIVDFRRSFKRAAAVAGVPDARIHDLRHTFASWLLAASGNLRLTGEALGHKRIETTMRYGHLLPGAKRAAIEDMAAAFAAVPAPKKEEDAA